MSDIPPRTHNLPSLADQLPRFLVQANIDAIREPLQARADALVASGERFIAAHPTIDDDEADALAAQVLATFQRFTGKSGQVETARVALKAPVLAADTAIGSLTKGPFAKLIEPVEGLARRISRASVVFKVAKEGRQRAAAQAEADRLAREAVEQEAAADQGHATYDEATAAFVGAEKAQDAANARPADLTRTHGELLGTSSLHYKRVVEVTSPADVPRIYCVPDVAAITRAAGKAGTPIPVISGVTIRDEPDLTVRR